MAVRQLRRPAHCPVAVFQPGRGGSRDSRIESRVYNVCEFGGGGRSTASSKDSDRDTEEIEWSVCS